MARGDQGLAQLVPVLVGAAALCAALLVRRSAPSLAWLALIARIARRGAVPFERARAGRARRRSASSAWTGLAVQAAACGPAHAGRRGRLRDATRSAGGSGRPMPLAFGRVALARARLRDDDRAGRQPATPTPDPAFTWVDVATAPLAFFLHLVLAVTALGIARRRPGRAAARARGRA